MMRIALTAAVALACAGPAVAHDFKLESPDAKPNTTIAEERVFNGFGCAGRTDGANLPAGAAQVNTDPPNATASLAGFMVNANSLDKASLTGKYGRGK